LLRVAKKTENDYLKYVDWARFFVSPVLDTLRSALLVSILLSQKAALVHTRSDNVCTYLARV